MSCPLLTQIRALPAEAIISSALNLLGFAELQHFLDSHHHVQVHVMTFSLAELIYYQLGSILAAKEACNNMTRLQLEHELHLKELLAEGEVLTDWKLRLRLAGAAIRKRQEDEERPQEEERSEDDLGEGPEAEADNDDDQDRKVIYTKNNGRTMVF